MNKKIDFKTNEKKEMLNTVLVYKLCSQVPSGYFTTYKSIANFIGISPRLVGQILKKNICPSEVVPCHRVIASNFFIGGFRGE
jgi:methylated-DNA-[protein]-cysteine S-methyltransferase